MSKFLVEPRATMSLGNSCAGCSTHTHPDGFVNTNLDGGHFDNGKEVRHFQGRVYFCAGCVREMGSQVGCLQPDQVAVLHGQLEEMSAAAEELRAELEREKDNKVLNAAEVFDYFFEREKRRPNEPKPATQPKKAS